MLQEQALVRLSRVVKTYPGPVETVTALKGIDLTVNAGEFVAVLGKSGAGKTTLVNVITGIDRITSGQIRVGGVDVHALGENKRAAWRGRNVGVVFQFFQLLPTLTALQNVMLPMDLTGRYSQREQRARAMHLLGQVGIAAHAHKLPAALSGGQQQRVAVARALANDPPLLIADEPTGNLDSATAGEVLDMLEALVDRGKTLLIVTHDKDLAARATRTIGLADGEIVKDMEEVRNVRRTLVQSAV
jgi:putative ABC transport system ATP-binding protein